MMNHLYIGWMNILFKSSVETFSRKSLKLVSATFMVLVAKRKME